MRPDVLLLQEVDLYTGRCGTNCNPECASRDKSRRTLNCGEKIANSLGMSMLLVTEMKILGGGIMANAILSHFPMTEVRALRHRSEFFKYDAHTTARGKGGGAFPRRGCRAAAVANIETPLGIIQFYSDHFEMRCNAEGRLAQLQDLLDDAQKSKYPSVIGGDLNTFLGGVTKLFPINSGSLSQYMRSKSLCSYCCCCGDFSEADLWKEREPFMPGSFVSSSSSPTVRKWLAGCIPVYVSVVMDILSLSFSLSLSLFTHTVRHVPRRYAQKLDWILLESRLKMESEIVGNNSMSMSDHAYLCVDIGLKPSS